jgi:hypothetical protein
VVEVVLVEPERLMNADRWRTEPLLSLSFSAMTG